MTPDEYQSLLTVLRMAIRDGDRLQVGLTLRKIMLHENPLYATAMSVVLGLEKKGAMSKKSKGEDPWQMPIKFHPPDCPELPKSNDEYPGEGLGGELSFEEILDQVIAESDQAGGDLTPGGDNSELVDGMVAVGERNIPNAASRKSSVPVSKPALGTRLPPPPDPASSFPTSYAHSLLSNELLPEYIILSLNGDFSSAIKIREFLSWAAEDPIYNWMFPPTGEGRYYPCVRNAIGDAMQGLLKKGQLYQGNTKGRYYVFAEYVEEYRARGFALVAMRGEGRDH